MTRIGILGALLAATACAPASPEGAAVEWMPVDSLNARLPESVRVYSGVNERLPIRAWYVRVDPAAARVHVAVSDDSDARESVSDFAAERNACIVVNGGYFRMDLNPARHVGLLKASGRIVEPAVGSVIRNERRYPVARAALGFTAAGRPHIAWVGSRNDSVFAWPDPIPNRPGAPAAFPDYTHARQWPMEDALSAGPLLLREGSVQIATDEEVFFGSSIPETHPRTAAGLTADGILILLVVDGRQPQSRGVDLPELAALMASAGAVDALNLDGGGSSTLVVRGMLVNRPVGGSSEREVMSAVTVSCD